MELEKGKISSSQLVFLISGFIIGSFVLLAFPGGIAKHDLWLTVLLGFGEGLVFVLIYITIAKRLPRNTLIEINDIIYGPFIGKIISILYILFFMLLLSLNIRTLSEHYITVIMPETPMVVFGIMITFVCASAVRKGLEVISRCSLVIVIMFIIETIITIVLLIKDIEITNFLPIFDLSLIDFIKSGNIINTVSFGEIIVLLMVVSYINKYKEIKKSVLKAVILGAAFLLLISLRNVAVLGITQSIHTYPSFEAVRLINYKNIITRLEIVSSMSLVIILFLKISVIYYAVVLAIAQLLNLRIYQPLVTPIGIIGICGSLILFEYYQENINFYTNIYPIFSLPFEIGIPLLSLIILLIRKLPKKGETVK
jgi:spore germination protein KB